MTDLNTRLVSCFQTVFPDLPDDQVDKPSLGNLLKWDSIAGSTLVNVLEEEFQIQIDFDRLADLDSFAKVLEYVRATLPATS